MKIKWNKWLLLATVVSTALSSNPVLSENNNEHYLVDKEKCIETTKSKVQRLSIGCEQKESNWLDISKRPLTLEDIMAWDAYKKTVEDWDNYLPWEKSPEFSEYFPKKSFKELAKLATWSRKYKEYKAWKLDLSFQEIQDYQIMHDNLISFQNMFQILLFENGKDITFNKKEKKTVDVIKFPTSRFLSLLYTFSFKDNSAVSEQKWLLKILEKYEKKWLIVNDGIKYWIYGMKILAEQSDWIRDTFFTTDVQNIDKVKLARINELKEQLRKWEEELRKWGEELRKWGEKLRQSKEELRQSKEELKQSEERLRKSEEELKLSEEELKQLDKELKQLDKELIQSNNRIKKLEAENEVLKIIVDSLKSLKSA